MEFALHILKPEEIARLIVMMPTEHAPVPQRFHWVKRVPKINPSHRSRPIDDTKMAPRECSIFWGAQLGIMHGPLLNGGGFVSRPHKPTDPLIFWNQVDDPEGYTRKQMELEVQALWGAREWLFHRFVRGESGEAPKLDGVVYLASDKMLECKIADCKNRFKVEDGMRIKRGRRRKAKPLIWKAIGMDEAVAKAWEHSGYTVRQIGKIWEVGIDPA